MGAAELGAQEGWGPPCLTCWHSQSLFLGQGLPSFRLCWSLVSGHGNCTREPVWSNLGVWGSQPGAAGLCEGDPHREHWVPYPWEELLHQVR